MFRFWTHICFLANKKSFDHFLILGSIETTGTELTKDSQKNETEKFTFPNIFWT
jgi:hypothetical protein